MDLLRTLCVLLLLHIELLPFSLEVYNGHIVKYKELESGGGEERRGSGSTSMLFPSLTSLSLSSCEDFKIIQ